MDEMVEELLRRAFGDQLRAERAASRMTQVQVARAAGISEASLIRYEQGTRSLPISTLYAIAEAVGFDPRRFMDEAQARFERIAPSDIEGRRQDR